MKQDDEENRNGSQTLDIGTEFSVLRRGTCFIA